MNGSCIIIGGGIGGLFTGAFLSKNGVKVTVLEKNSIIGGGLQCFTRKGKTFETGMHIAGGFGPNGSLHEICRYLGISHKLKLQEVPSECSDEIYYRSSNELFKIASGRQKFTERLIHYFPHEAKGITAYVDELFRLTEEVPLFSLHEDSPLLENKHSDNFLISADSLIDKFVKDKKLREILAYLNPLYGGVKGHTPAYIHAILNVLYINGATRFIGGGQQLANALCEIITDNGGVVKSNSPVVKIAIEDKAVQYVQIETGERYIADNYVSAIHPLAMVNIASHGAFRKSFVHRLNEIPNSTSAFSIYIDLKPNSFKYIDHTCYYSENFGLMWEQERQANQGIPNSFMYMTPPDENQGQYANRLLIHCLMSFEMVKKWENTVSGKRGSSYEEWKTLMVNNLIDKLSNLYPHLRDCISDVYSSSPLTIRDFYNTKNGAIFGFRKDCENLLISRLPVYTKISNLFLTGQNVILHGICGVPLTAINTSEAILGKNVIINAIQRQNENC